MWLSKALPRRSRSLGDVPSKKQLTPEETSHLNSILEEKFYASADNAAEVCAALCPAMFCDLGCLFGQITTRGGGGSLFSLLACLLKI